MCVLLKVNKDQIVVCLACVICTWFNFNISFNYDSINGWQCILLTMLAKPNSYSALWLNITIAYFCVNFYLLWLIVIQILLLFLPFLYILNYLSYVYNYDEVGWSLAYLLCNKERFPPTCSESVSITRSLLCHYPHHLDWPYLT